MAPQAAAPGVGTAVHGKTRFATVALLAVALACGRADQATPDQAVRAFAAAVAAGDAERTWALLAPDTQAWLDARARRAAAAAPGVVPPRGRALLLGDASLAAAAPRAAIVLRESAGVAVVAVEGADGGRRELDLVRAGGGWRLRLEEP